MEKGSWRIRYQRKTVDSLLLNVLHKMDPERAHDMALWGLRRNSLRKLLAYQREFPSLASEVFGLHFPNPIGLAAGFDKNAEAVEPLSSLGFGFLEVGTVTPQPQEGNPLPRLFRKTDEQALLNHMGLNNCGGESAAKRLHAMKNRDVILGINLGANTDAADKTADYIKGVQRFAELADYLVLNLSCPNIAGVRDLQDATVLEQLFDRVNKVRDRGKPLLVKLAPDLAQEKEQAIASLVLGGGVDGLIISNTMPAKMGGISGRPLFAPSTRSLARIYRLTLGRVPLVGVGGIFSAEDAYAKIRAGASLLQLYTALIYEGPGLVGRILEGMANLLARDGYGSIADAVGCDAAAEENAAEKQRQAVA